MLESPLAAIEAPARNQALTEAPKLEASAAVAKSSLADRCLTRPA
jgi:hypothetical protein